jgi:hypothetical protein
MFVMVMFVLVHEKTFNIQHSTPNIQENSRSSPRHWALNVECWMLDVAF